MLTLDSLHEQADAPVPGLTHRYPDKALFLVLDTCPVYCRFCTRSYAVGVDTEEVEKVSLRVNKDRWSQAFQYMRERTELEDVVISGGDAYRLKAKPILEVGEQLLSIPHIRRFRFAARAGDSADEIAHGYRMGGCTHHDCGQGAQAWKRGRGSHPLQSPNEVTDISRRAMNVLFERGVTVESNRLPARRKRYG